MSLKGVNFKLSATNAAAPAFKSFNNGLSAVKKNASAANGTMRSWNAGLNANRRAVQQLGFQVSDFAIQIAGGQSAMLAFTQQGGQMLQFFGPAGAVLAGLVAVFGSLYIGITKSGVAIDQLYPYLGALENEFRGLVEAIRSVVSVMGNVATTIVDNLDVIIISMAVAVGWFATRWVAGVIRASITTGALSNVLRATAVSFQLAGTGAAAATLATSAFTGALNLLRAALMRLGLPAIIIAAGYLIERFLTLARGAGGFGEALALLADVARAAFSEMDILAAALADAMRGTALQIAASFLNAFADISEAFGQMISDFLFYSPVLEAMGINLGKIVGPVGKSAAASMRSTADGLASAATGYFSAAAAALNGATKTQEAVQRLKDAIAAGEINSPKPIWGGDEEDEGGGGGGGKGGGGGAKKAVEKAKEAADKIKEIFENMRDAISASMLSGFKALMSGAKSFGDVAIDILKTIADKIVDILMTPVFDRIAGSIASSFLGAAGSLAVPSFEGGGDTWSGPRAGGLDGKGGRLALLHPDETVTDHRLSGGNGDPTVRVVGGDLTLTDDGTIAARFQVVEDRAVNRVQKNLRKSKTWGNI